MLFNSVATSEDMSGCESFMAVIKRLTSRGGNVEEQERGSGLRLQKVGMPPPPPRLGQTLHMMQQHCLHLLSFFI